MSTAATTQPIFRTCEGKPAGIRGSLAVRRCGDAGEYLNGENLKSLSLYLNG